jgi:hypothetical protein
LGNLFIHAWSDVSAIAIWLALMLTLLRAKNSSHHDFRAIKFSRRTKLKLFKPFRRIKRRWCANGSIHWHAADTDSAPGYHVVVSFRIMSRPTSVF